VVTGLFDFGAMQIDTPATDVARLLGSLGTVPFSRDEAADTVSGSGAKHVEAAKRGRSSSPAWCTGLAAYSAIRLLSPQETAAVAALDTSGTILAGANWIRWIYVDGRRFENRKQVIERFARIFNRTESLNHSLLGHQSEAREHGYGSP
jgi:hypothetical protein